MKNLVLFAGVLVAVSFASCGNKAEQAAPAEEAVVEEVVEVADSCCADSCCADSCCADSAVVAE